MIFYQKNSLFVKSSFRHPHHGMIVTNLTRLPFPDLDFSQGAPVNFSTYAEITGSAAIFPAENGVDILVATRPKEFDPSSAVTALPVGDAFILIE